MCRSDRRRGCRLGSFAYADTHGVHGCHDIIQVRPSSICDGLGVFATRFLPRGTPITRYHGRLVDKDVKLASAEQMYAYMFSKKKYLVGESRLDRLHRKGVGQLLNDAIHVEVSGGLENNCEFVHHDNHVYIAAIRDIRPGTELLVNYHISYWVTHPERDKLPQGLQHWTACHQAVQAALTKKIGPCEIDDYQGLHELPNDEHGNVCTELCCAPGHMGLARYTLNVLKQQALSIDAVTTCKCAQVPRVSSCEVLLHQCGAPQEGTTHVLWRCLDCSMRTFEHVDTVRLGSVAAPS
jgi:SET domain